MKKKKEKPVDTLMWDNLRKVYKDAVAKKRAEDEKEFIKENPDYNIIVEINKHFKK